MRYEHEFEDEEGNEIPLTDITYEVIKTYVQPDSVGIYASTFSHEEVIVFTHVVKIRPESLDLELAVMNMTKEEVEDHMRDIEPEGGENG